MGRTAPAAPPYRDDPDAVSLHTTPDDYDYDAPEITGLPPSYADSEISSAAATAPVLRHVPPPRTRMDHNSVVKISGGSTGHWTDGCYFLRKTSQKSILGMECGLEAYNTYQKTRMQVVPLHRAPKQQQ